MRAAFESAPAEASHAHRQSPGELRARATRLAGRTARLMGRTARAIDRLREFPSSRVAAAYAAFVAELAAAAQTPIDVLVTGGQVVVTIHGNAARRGGALTEAAPSSPSSSAEQPTEGRICQCQKLTRTRTSSVPGRSCSPAPTSARTSSPTSSAAAKKGE